MSSLEKAKKLVEHARTVINETNKMAFEMTPEVKKAAPSKIEYAKKVVVSISEASLNLQSSMSDPELRMESFEIFGLIMTSIVPQLEMAIKQLEDSINTFSEEVVIEPEMTPEEIRAQMEADMERLTGGI